MIEREWRLVCAMRVLLLAIATAIVASCSEPPRQHHASSVKVRSALESSNYIPCTQERDCKCGWCPPYGQDG